VLVVIGVLLIGTPMASAHDMLWGAAGGVAGGFALIAFYRALSFGTMTVVAPTTAIVSAVLPVIVGLVLGERPSVTALVGIVAACLAVALVSGAIGTRHQHTHASTWRSPFSPVSDSGSSSSHSPALQTTVACGRS
jgi:drug/metabolite transporter (DMT)-like permease